MKINELFKTDRTVLSFEIFPPKRHGEIMSIYHTIDELAKLSPDYISVTYGAAGLERESKTTEIASRIKNDYKIESLAHLTSVGATFSEIERILRQFENNHIENILALRGDLPVNTPQKTSDFMYACDLIQFIQMNGEFCIGAACYPEAHIEAKSRTVDLIHLLNKVNSGADFLVTQLFFDNQKYYEFEHEARSLDINIPITVGIMPALNRNQIEKMVQLSGASMPEKFSRILCKYDRYPEALKEAGISYACEQIVELLSTGVDGIHIYVMNRPEIAKRIIDNLKSVLKIH